jgi:hypothetical protein
MTQRENFEAVLDGKVPDYVPFVFREGLIGSDELRQQVLDSGACALVTAHAYSSDIRGVKIEETIRMGEGGRQRKQMTYSTPLGDLMSVDVQGDVSWWMEEPVFKSSSDYRPLFHLLENVDYQPTYEELRGEDARYGDRGIARVLTEKNPIFEMMHIYMGIEKFAYEWVDHRSSVLQLYDILLENRRRRLEIVARSPAQFVVIDGNIEMSVVGLERFDEYYAPVIAEACDLLHEHGKKTGLHLDSNNRQFIEPVSRLPVDFIESLTPPPDCDLSVEEALRVWPDLFFMVNFPSSVHLKGIDAVKSLTERIIGESGDSHRIVMGIHENVPRFDTVLPLVEATCVSSLGSAGSY